MVSTEVKRLTEIILALAAIAGLSAFVLALGEPVSPDNLNIVQSSNFNASLISVKSVEAIAGNVTELNITAQSMTQSWQGYYGNITGTITLEDSVGNVFYDWTAAEPEGEIFATTNNSVTWTNIKCFNYTANGASEINLTTEETRYGIGPNDDDGIDITYNTTVHPEFYVGLTQIATDTCPATNPYVSSAYQTADFHNVLLVDPDGNSLIFTTIIENDDALNNTDKTGYNGQAYDFQMLVAEDGHGAAVAASTTYYFWVEIE